MHLIIIRPGLTACLVLALGLAGGCQYEPDLAERASQALAQANLGTVRVDWDKDAQVAHLQGTVDQPTDRQRAEDVASAAIGTSGRVINEVPIRNANETTADDLDRGVRNHLEQAVAEDPLVRDRDIDFEVHSGAVTITGKVRSAAEKTRVTKIVRGAPGVKDLANALEIAAKK